MTPQEQEAFYAEHGYLHVAEVFSPAETDELAADLDRLIQEWAFEGARTGPD